MERFAPEVSDGVLYLRTADERVEVGPVSDIVDAVGAADYELNYDESQRTQPWLDTDDGTLHVDVEEVVTTMDHPPEFVAELREHSLATDRYGIPERAVAFADHLADILDQYGQ